MFQNLMIDGTEIKIRLKASVRKAENIIIIRNSSGACVYSMLWLYSRMFLSTAAFKSVISKQCLRTYMKFYVGYIGCAYDSYNQVHLK